MSLADDLAAIEAGRAANKFGGLQPILARWFPPRRGGHAAYVNNGVDIDKLDKDHRKILAALSSFDTYASFGHSGLPPDARSRRRLLGLAPKTLLEDTIKGVPRWRILREALDKYSKLNREKRPTALEHLRDKYGFKLTSAEWLELGGELAAKAYGLDDYGGVLDTAVERATGDEVMAWAERWRSEDVLGTRLAAVVVKKTGKLPPEYDSSINQYGLSREILEALPMERRIGVVTNIFENPRANFDMERIAKLLDLVPEATNLLIAHHVRQNDEDFLKDDWTDEVVTLTKLRKTHPRIDAILAAHEKRPRTPKPKPVKKKKPKSDYSFESSKSFTRKQLEAFKGERKKQLLVALEKFNAAKTIAAFYKKEAEDGDDAEPPQLWTITHKGEPKYEMWVFLVDNGTVFELGSSKLTGVEMMQGGFLAKKPKQKVLAAALQEIVPF